MSIRILFVARRAYPQIGGVEKHISKVSQELKKLGYKVDVISETNIKYPKVKFLGLLFIWLWVVGNLDTFKKYDIIHAHDVTIWLLPLKVFLPSKPIYSTFHGWEGKYPIPVKNKLIRKISTMISKRNICVGKFIERWYGIKADQIIYGGV
jgi:glycosyltransferase involved in cell wall biosynthesis